MLGIYREGCSPIFFDPQEGVSTTGLFLGIHHVAPLLSHDPDTIVTAAFNITPSPLFLERHSWPCDERFETSAKHLFVKFLSL